MTTDEALAALGRYASDEDRARAIEHVRRMAAVVEAGRHRDECGEECRVMHPYRGCVCGDEPMRAALRALDGGERG